MATSPGLLPLATINDTVRKFEQCEFRPEDFHHRDHLTVITCYLEQAPVCQAQARIRDALKRFTAHHNVKGYNETITRFWIAKVAQILVTEADGLALPEQIERVHTALGNKELLFDYYTRQRTLSEEAKQSWVAPDLRGL
jgi:hypothetical protein